MILFIVESLDNEKDKELILMIYEKYAPWLRSRAYKITQDYEISNDLVHDCIIKLIKHVDKLKDFKIEDGRLLKYKRKTGDVIIPDTVAEISTWAFSESEKISSVKIPDSVITIYDGAFKNC